MTDQGLLLAAVLLPLVGALLFLPYFERFLGKISRFISVIPLFLSVCCSVAMLPGVYQGNPAAIHWQLPYGLDFGFQADGLALFMALYVSILGIVVIFYSWGYMSGKPERNRYHLLLSAFIGGILGMVYADNLLLIYLFGQVAVLSSWRLIAFWGGKEREVRGGKVLLMLSAGLILMFVAFLVIYHIYGTFSLPALVGMGANHVVMILMVCGILTQCAIVPFHSWLMNVGSAPAPATALLEGAVLVQMGVYLFARIFLVHMVMPSIWHYIIPIIATISSLLAAGVAFVEKDMIRALSYGTVSQVGLLIFGLACSSPMSVAGAMLGMVTLGSANAVLYLCAGTVEARIQTRNLNEMDGLARLMPVTHIAFLVATLSLIGIPPFVGFWDKYFVIAGAIEAGYLWQAALFIVCSFITVIYLLRIYTKIFLGPIRYADVKAGSWEMVTAVVLVAVAIVGLGIFINGPVSLLQVIVGAMGGVVA